MPSTSSSSTENPNTKYSICIDTNIGISMAAAVAAEEAPLIEFNGRNTCLLKSSMPMRCLTI
jgi:hypothetical protein